MDLSKISSNSFFVYAFCIFIVFTIAFFIYRFLKRKYSIEVPLISISELLAKPEKFSNRVVILKGFLIKDQAPVVSDFHYEGPHHIKLNGNNSIYSKRADGYELYEKYPNGQHIHIDREPRRRWVQFLTKWTKDSNSCESLVVGYWEPKEKHLLYMKVI